MWAKSKSSIANTAQSKTTSITNGSMTTNTELIIINAVESSWPGGYLTRHVDVWNMIGELIIIVALNKVHELSFTRSLKPIQNLW